jgi:hypothetical protein
MTEIEESNRQLCEAWKLYARVSAGGETFDLKGLRLRQCEPALVLHESGRASKCYGQRIRPQEQGSAGCRVLRNAKEPVGLNR